MVLRLLTSHERWDARAAWLCVVALLLCPLPASAQWDTDYGARALLSSHRSFSSDMGEVWDALTYTLFEDDCQVVQWSGSKRVAQPGERPGVYIQLWRIE